MSMIRFIRLTSYSRTSNAIDSLRVWAYSSRSPYRERGDMEFATPQRDASDPETRKLEIEEKKLELEFERIRVERIKAWSGNASVIGSILLVAATIALGIWSQHKQGLLQHELQERQARAQFELKAAEIVMDTEHPGVTFNKAKALQNLFPNYLSLNFAESFVPDSFARAEDVTPAATALPV